MVAASTKPGRSGKAHSNLPSRIAALLASQSLQTPIEKGPLSDCASF